MYNRKYGRRFGGTRKLVRPSIKRIKARGLRKRSAATRVRPSRVSRIKFTRRVRGVSRGRGRRIIKGRRMLGSSSSSTLKRRSEGPINTVYKYRCSGRRAFKVDRRMAKKVALATGHVIEETDLINGSVESTAGGGDAAWTQFIIGTVAQSGTIAAVVHANAVGYQEADWNTSYGTASAGKLHIKIMDYSNTFIAFNCANSHMNVEIYPIYLRADMSVSSATPIDFLGQDRAQDLPIPTTSAMSYLDPRFTPFMCPGLCQHYKIGKVKKFSVHGGGRFDFSLRHSWDITPAADVYPSGLVAKKGSFRCLLIKTYGQLGLQRVGDPANFYVRHVQSGWAYQQRVMWRAHLSYESRKLFKDNDLARGQPIASSVSEFENQEKQEHAVDVITVPTGTG